jgi:peptidoglycan glycosyltransferase
MTQNIQRLAQFILIGFALIAASLFYWQVMRAPGLVAREDNPRLVQAELRAQRGRLLDRRGEALAYSDPLPDPTGLGGVVQRRYPHPEASHAAGYYSLRYGTGGAESAFDNTLLGERQGAVVLLDIATGEVLALVSHPSYDPNTLDDDWDALTEDLGAPLLNRATQGVYALGDLARLVGLTGLLSAGITTPPDPHTTSLEEMLAPLSDSGYLATARQLGFDASPPFDLPTGPGLLSDFQDQGTPRDLAVTPLHMARLAAAIADDGHMPAPTLAYPGSRSTPNRVFAPGVAASLQAMTPRLDGLAGWAGVATPQETGDQPLSWFVGYAPSDAPRFAIAVVVEGDDRGVTATLPIAQQTVNAVQE